MCLYRTNPSQPLAYHSPDQNPIENAWDEDAAEGDTSHQPGGVEGWYQEAVGSQDGRFSVPEEIDGVHAGQNPGGHC